MRPGRLIRSLIAAGAWTLAVCTAPAGAEPGPASDTVERLHEVLLQVMRDAERLGYSGRREQVEPAVARGFDLDFISRIVLSQYWGGMDETQRRAMVRTMHDLTVATYASRFDGYSGERFVVLREEPARNGRRLVRTELRKSDGGKVQLDYLLQEVDGSWRIVNVISDGVSELSLKRAQYGSIINSEGFDALLGKIQDQVRRYEGGT